MALFLLCMNIIVPAFFVIDQQPCRLLALPSLLVCRAVLSLKALGWSCRNSIYEWILSPHLVVLPLLTGTTCTGKASGCFVLWHVTQNSPLLTHPCVYAC